MLKAKPADTLAWRREETIRRSPHARSGRGWVAHVARCGTSGRRGADHKPVRESRLRLELMQESRLLLSRLLLECGLLQRRLLLLRGRLLLLLLQLWRRLLLPLLGCRRDGGAPRPGAVCLLLLNARAVAVLAAHVYGGGDPHPLRGRR